MIFSTMEFLILLLNLTIIVILITQVYKHSIHSATNILFILLALNTFIWLVALYFSFLPYDFIFSVLWWIRISLLFACIQGILFFLFAHTFPHKKLQLANKYFYSLIIATITLIIIALSPYGFSTVEIINNFPNPQPEAGIIFYSLILSSIYIITLYVLLKKYYTAVAAQKRQLFLIFIGALCTIFLLLVTVPLPIILYRHVGFVRYIPIYTLCFLIPSAYAIIRYRLFDIRFLFKKEFLKIFIFSGATTIAFLISFVIVVSIKGDIYFFMAVAFALTIAAQFFSIKICDRYLGFKEKYDFSLAPPFFLQENMKKNLAILINNLNKVLKKYNISAFHFFIYNYRDKNYRSLEAGFRSVIDEHDVIILALQHYAKVICKESLANHSNLPNYLKEDILKFFNKNNYTGVMALSSGEFIYGLILFKNVTPDSASDLLALGNQFGLYLEQIMNYAMMVSDSPHVKSE